MIRLRAHQGDDNDSKEKWDDYDDKERRLLEFKVIPQQTHLGRINSTTNTTSFSSHHPCIKTKAKRPRAEEEMKRKKNKKTEWKRKEEDEENNTMDAEHIDRTSTEGRREKRGLIGSSVAGSRGFDSSAPLHLLVGHNPSRFLRARRGLKLLREMERVWQRKQDHLYYTRFSISKLYPPQPAQSGSDLGANILESEQQTKRHCVYMFVVPVLFSMLAAHQSRTVW